MKVGVVGAQEDKWTQDKKTEAVWRVRYVILETLDKSHWDKSAMSVVSGHCPYGGVDIWAEECAKELGIPTEIYPSEVNFWEDKGEDRGYKSRNIQIAEASDVLYCINPKGLWTGGSWTLKYFKEHFPDRKGELIEL